MKNGILIHDLDNVVVALERIEAREYVRYRRNGEEEQVEALEDIPIYHKIAVDAIKMQGPVLKYGEIIGTALKDICPGEYVHIHNMKALRGRGDL